MLKFIRNSNKSRNIKREFLQENRKWHRQMQTSKDVLAHYWNIPKLWTRTKNLWAMDLVLFHTDRQKKSWTTRPCCCILHSYLCVANFAVSFGQCQLSIPGFLQQLLCCQAAFFYHASYLDYLLKGQISEAARGQTSREGFRNNVILNVCKKLIDLLCNFAVPDGALGRNPQKSFLYHVRYVTICSGCQESSDGNAVPSVCKLGSV